MNIDPSLAQIIIESLDTVAVFDSEGKYIYVNACWLKKFDIKAEDVLGKHPNQIGIKSKIDIVIQTRRPLVGEFFIKDGSNEISTVAYYPIFKDDKVIAGVVFDIFQKFDLAMAYKEKVSHLANEVVSLKNELRKLKGARYTVDNIIGASSVMCELRESIFRAARSSSTVIIEGETGTGKELVAHAIHNSSSRSAFNFIKVNCAAIPSELLEAEFFGYEAGAFTGAAKGGRQGKFEMAHKGSLFLDEVDQLPMALQSKLLRVLQEKEVDRIGGKKSVEIDVRIIVASNANLGKLIEENKFREDLFYRLNVIQISIPPLRERREDIPLLVRHLMMQLNHQLGSDVKEISPDVVKALLEYNWPGNVRELQNVLERAMNIAWNGELNIQHFKKFIDNYKKSNIHTEKLASTLKEFRDLEEKKAIIKALEDSDNNKVLAAKKLNISRMQLYRKMRLWGVGL